MNSGVLSSTGVRSPAAPAEPTRSALIRSHRDAALLGLLVGSITACNLIWTSRDSHRLYWDFARHLGNSISYKDEFAVSHPLRFFTTYLYPNPPFVYWVTDVFYGLFGTDLWVAILSNVVFLTVLVFAVYGIGTLLWSRRVGLLSAVFVVTSPMFVTQLKWYMLDVPLSAMVALALYLLIRSDDFARRRSSFLFGVAVGIGMLTKWPFAFFLALPTVVGVATALVRARRERAVIGLVNVSSAALIAFAIASVWYIPNLRPFTRDLGAATNVPPSVMDAPAVGSLSSWLWYFWDLVNNGLYLLPFLFFVVGVVFLLRKDESAAKLTPLVLSVVGGYLAFSSLALKDFRYVMPMIPSVAVIATHWLDYLKPTRRRWLAALLATYGVLMFFVISFGTSVLPQQITIPIKARSFTSNILNFIPPESKRVTGVVVFAQHGFIIGKPSSQKWYQDTVFKEIDSRSHGATFWYSGPADELWFQTWGIRYYALRYRARWVAYPQQAQFLIVRGAVPRGVTRGFVELKRYRLPYSGPLRLYERV